jgi:hypothetical protein
MPPLPLDRYFSSFSRQGSEAAAQTTLPVAQRRGSRKGGGFWKAFRHNRDF